MEEFDKEIEIGLPTDVKHVTHIGIDGSASNSIPIKGWEDLTSPVSLQQFELSMASQAAADHQPNHDDHDHEDDHEDDIVRDST